ncbi:MAG: hypothetical protein LV479_09950 [Methylacidiphilales bacterium]|nr:hypothetical protein [Candidatus Methylacidiphilales bacterium]
MKKKAQTLPKKLGDEFDLTYIETLSEQERRAATFYEYARHSGPIKDLIMELRKEGIFSGSGREASPELFKKLLPKMTSGILKGDELIFLTNCTDFPDQPFRLTAEYRNLFGSGTQSFGIKAPCFFPWKAVDAFRSDWRSKGLNEAEMLAKAGWYPVYLPWGNYTDEEITEMLGERIGSLRPSHAPEPKRPGRKGSSKSLGTLDMVRQLKAYRLHATCCDRPPRLYQSEKGWNQAIRAAEKRIEGMMERPFFGSS